MTQPWTLLATESTPEGKLELRRRGDKDFVLTVDGRVLMNSASQRSEEALATLGCARVADRRAPRVLIAGLGMGVTLRAALDSLPPAAQVTVAELTPTVVTWCRGPLAPLTDDALSDPRVRVVVGDVSKVIASAPPRAFDAILLDLYEGPHAATQRKEDPFFGSNALGRAKAALERGGVFGVWSEEPDPQFPGRLEKAGFTVSVHRPGKAGRTHVVYLGSI
jgi:spermidine synthase